VRICNCANKLLFIQCPNTNSCNSVILRCSCIIVITIIALITASRPTTQCSSISVACNCADVEFDADQRVQSAPRIAAAVEQWRRVGAVNVCQSVNRLYSSSSITRQSSSSTAVVDVSFQLWLLLVHVLNTTRHSYIAISSYNHYTTVNAATCVRSALLTALSRDFRSMSRDPNRKYYNNQLISYGAR